MIKLEEMSSKQISEFVVKHRIVIRQLIIESNEGHVDVICDYLEGLNVKDSANDNLYRALDKDYREFSKHVDYFKKKMTKYMKEEKVDRDEIILNDTVHCEMTEIVCDDDYLYKLYNVKDSDNIDDEVIAKIIELEDDIMIELKTIYYNDNLQIRHVVKVYEDDFEKYVKIKYRNNDASQRDLEDTIDEMLRDIYSDEKEYSYFKYYIQQNEEEVIDSIIANYKNTVTV